MPKIYTKQDKSRQELFLLDHKSPKAESWDDVIALAKGRIESLKAVIQVFEKYREANEPFIGGLNSRTESESGG